MEQGGREKKKKQNGTVSLKGIHFEKSYESDLIPEETKKILIPVSGGWNSGSVCITNGRWGCHHMASICVKIEKWGVSTKLILSLNFNSGILESIRHIKFPLLRELTLPKNLIQSIQGIQHLCCPNLKTLHLSSNMISSIAPLRKASFLKLQTLSFSFNPIRDVSALSQLHSPNFMNRMSLSSINDSSTWWKVVKLEMSDLKWIKISQLFDDIFASSMRLDNNNSVKAKKVFKKKWPVIKIDGVL